MKNYLYIALLLSFIGAASTGYCTLADFFNETETRFDAESRAEGGDMYANRNTNIGTVKDEEQRRD